MATLHGEDRVGMHITNLVGELLLQLPEFSITHKRREGGKRWDIEIHSGMPAVAFMGISVGDAVLGKLQQRAVDKMAALIQGAFDNSRET